MDNQRIINSFIFVVLIIFLLGFIFIFVGHSNKFGLNSFNIFNISILNPFSAIYYAFFHVSIEHIVGNSLGFLLFGIPFFYLYGIKKGIKLSLLIIFISAYLEYITIKILFLILSVFKISSFKEFLSVTVYGVGLSGLDAGFASILYVETNKKLKEKSPDFKLIFTNLLLFFGLLSLFALNIFLKILGFCLLLIVFLYSLRILEKDDSVTSIVEYFYLISMITISLGTVIFLSIGDLYMFTFIPYANLIVNLGEKNIIITTISMIQEFLLSTFNTEGNSFLAHVFGIILGFIFGFKFNIKSEQVQSIKEINQTNSII